MPEVSLNIPAIGEGLQEARVVALLKQPGDTVKRDEAIYQMETDKAVMDVESPYAGTVKRWLAKVDDVLSIGAPVMLMETADPAPEAAQAPSAAPAQAGTVSLNIPAIGEGLQEARLVAKLKNVGDKVKRDETIYQMETDKAVMDVESPYEGEIVAWLAEVDQVLPIGAEVLRMTTTDAVAPAPAAGPAPSTAPAATVAAPVGSAGRRRDVPPRTRAYARQKGLTDAQIESVPAAGSKLMPEDIDRHLVVGTAPSAETAPTRGANYSERAMGSRQRVLSSRLQRGNQLVVPGMMSVVCDWSGIERSREKAKASGSDFQPSSFTMFAFAVAKACSAHPIVRSTLVGDSMVRTYDHIQLGIAVALPGDELVVAVVKDADKLTWQEFASQARENIHLARNGQDQANESVTLSITNMQAYGIREAMAVVVPPGVATIFLGEPYNGLANTPGELKLQRCCNVGITIDHRLINGVGGAEFLNAIKANVESIEALTEA